MIEPDAGSEHGGLIWLGRDWTNLAAAAAVALGSAAVGMLWVMTHLDHPMVQRIGEPIARVFAWAVGALGAAGIVWYVWPRKVEGRGR